MATKISAMTLATVMGSDDYFPIIQSAANKRVTKEVFTRLVLNAQVGTTYILLPADINKTVTLENASPIIVTIPTQAAQAIEVGSQITIVQLGAGQVSVAGAGVTIRSADSRLKLRVQYSSATVIKIDTNTWLLLGDITT